MKSTRALQLAIDMARRSRDDAAVQLAQAQAQQQQAKLQQSQLQAYALDSTRRWFDRAQQGVAMGLVQQHDHFMGKLDHAIIFQGDVLVSHEKRVAERRAVLLAADQQLKRYEHMLTTWQHEMAQRQARQEQKQTDEQAMQAHRRQQMRAKAAQA